MQNANTPPAAHTSTGLLGDTPQRNYSAKLSRFQRFAASELQALIGELGLRGGDRVLDAGCGAGLVCSWLAAEVAPGGLALGIDLASAHARQSRINAPQAAVVQADLSNPPLQPASFRLVWCMNTINHLRDPQAGVHALLALTQPGGKLVLAQSHFLPEMIFAWDMRLERVVTEACRRYYHDSYGLDERATTAIRGLVGLLRAADVQRIRARTITIERLAPLDQPASEYIEAAIFRGYWGTHIRPYLDPADWDALQRLTDPSAPTYALRRADFHYLQTLTIVEGTRV